MGYFFDFPISCVGNIASSHNLWYLDHLLRCKMEMFLKWFGLYRAEKSTAPTAVWRRSWWELRGRKLRRRPTRSRCDWRLSFLEEPVKTANVLEERWNKKEIRMKAGNRLNCMAWFRCGSSVSKLEYSLLLTSYVSGADVRRIHFRPFWKKYIFHV